MSSKPNFLFILTDDQGPWAMHCAGNPDILTPNIDSVAANGVRFEHFFCASPVCSPARASILTGKIPSAHGIHDWLRSGNVDKEKMDRLGINNPYGGYADENKPIQYLSGQRTYTDALVEQGYTCALAGKWHLGDSLSPQHGFSHWYTIGKGGAHYYYPDIVENGSIKIENAYITNKVTDKALSWLEQFSRQDNPFYLSVHYTAPHAPWEREHHPEEYVNLYENCRFDSIPDVPDHPDKTGGPVYQTPRRKTNLQGYFAAITAMDACVGTLLEALDAYGLRENTVVIFTSDNGMCMGHHGIWGKGNGTFPQNMYEESVQVPFILSYPPLTNRSGKTIENLASALDIYPTILDLAQISDPQTFVLPGQSLLPIIRGQKDPSTDGRCVFVFEEYGPVRMLRTSQYKYIHRYPYGPHEFYDLQQDPREEINQIAEPCRQRMILEMRHQLNMWCRKYVDPDVDGSREAVTGWGQLCRAGLYADCNEVYKIE